MALPLRQWTIGGYRFNEKTFYNDGHTGLDLRCYLEELLSPFNDGYIYKNLVGLEGGKTIWYKRDNKPEILRFLHLNEFRKKPGERVSEGHVMAITGNTGTVNGKKMDYHLHLDIPRSEKLLNDFLAGRETDVNKVFIDPEKYDWESNNNDIIMENVMKKNKNLWQALSDGSLYWVNEGKKKFYKIDSSNSTQNERVLYSMHAIKTIDAKHEKFLEDNYIKVKEFKEVL